jgi:hypothetical protein
MHPTALYHMVVSFGLMPTCFFPAKPNNLVSDKDVAISNIAGYDA